MCINELIDHVINVEGHRLLIQFTLCASFEGKARCNVSPLGMKTMYLHTGLRPGGKRAVTPNRRTSVRNPAARDFEFIFLCTFGQVF